MIYLGCKTCIIDEVYHKFSKCFYWNILILHQGCKEQQKICFNFICCGKSWWNQEQGEDSCKREERERERDVEQNLTNELS